MSKQYQFKLVLLGSIYMFQRGTDVLTLAMRHRRIRSRKVQVHHNNMHTCASRLT